MQKQRTVVAQNLHGVFDGFDYNKHSGKIRCEGGMTYYMTQKDIVAADTDAQGRKYLTKGQDVIFDLCEVPRGFKARNIRAKNRSPPISKGKTAILRNVRGEIDSVKPEKKYCIIRTSLEEYKTLLGHFSNFKQEPAYPPRVGTNVLCDVAKEENGKLVALRVQLLRSNNNPTVASTGLRVIAEAVEGEVSRLKKERGYGIIATQKYGTLLCHYTDIKAEAGGMMNLQVNQKVVCDVAENRQKKYVAINLQPKEMSDSEISLDQFESMQLGATGKAKSEIAAEDELICNICLSVPENPVTSPCDHLFCWECISKWLGDQPICPVDGRRITIEDIKEPPRYVKNILESMSK